MSVEEYSAESMIRLLTEIADGEIGKPEREMDCDLIKRCSELAERIRGGSADPEEIKAGVAGILAKNREKILRDRIRRRKRFLRIAAAACAVMAVSLPFTIRAARQASAAELLPAFGVTCRQGDDGQSVSVGDTEIATAWEKSVYGSVSALLGKEKRGILYPVPSKMPEGLHVESATVYELELGGGGKGEMVAYTFTDPSLAMSVFRFDLAGMVDRRGCEAEDIDGTTWYFRRGDGGWQAFCETDGLCCSAVGEDRDLLVGLIGSLDMS